MNPNDKSYHNFSRHQSIFQYDDNCSIYSKKTSDSEPEKKSFEKNQIVFGQAIGSMQTTTHANAGTAYYSFVNV